MQADINGVWLTGRLVRDPSVKPVNDNSKKCSFSIAVGHVSGKQERRREEVSFFDVEAWGGLAETIGKYCKKGQQISIKGELKQERWEGRDGSNKSRIVIKAERVQFLGSRKNDSTQEQPEQEQPEDEDDIPF